MTEIKADLYQETIYNRKKFFEKKNTEYLDRSVGAVMKRQNILLSVHADTLSDEELIRHKRDLTKRKFLCYISFFVIPGALFYFKYSQRALVISLVPSLILANVVYGIANYNSKCSLSNSLAENSNKRFLEKICHFNHKRFSTHRDLFKESNNSIPLKDWIARNEYR